MKKNPLQLMADRFAVSAEEVKNIIMRTVMPNGGAGVSEEQFFSFVAVANEYGLNPLTKEVYAFPAKGGGIQPIVSIDGWLKIINGHPHFNGMTFEDIREAGRLVAVKCKIFKKGIDHPVEVVEYLDECFQPKDTWKKWPSRMLRHKAAIQCGRYAFGLSGIIDPDEAERYQEVGEIKTIDCRSDSDFVDLTNDINALKICQTSEQLRVAWQEVYRKYEGSPHLPELVKAKDEKKEALKKSLPEPEETVDEWLAELDAAEGVEHAPAA